MNVAVVSLCRDRIDYTRHCFTLLNHHAGCDFDHYVLDQGSADGTPAWLQNEFKETRIHTLCLNDENIGIHRGLNVLLDEVGEGYDVVVNFDNDCEFIVPDTLKAVCEVHLAHPDVWIGPVVNGLRNPPRFVSDTVYLAGYKVRQTPMIGGILMPIPPGWRYPEHDAPPNGDGLISAQAQWCGQLIDFPVNHVDTTDGQHVRYPEYFARRVAEGTPD